MITRNVLMFNQILPASNIRNIRKTVRKICMWIMRPVSHQKKKEYIYMYICIYIYIYIFIKNWTRYIGFLAF